MKIDPSLGLPAKYTDWRESQYQAVQAVVASDRPAFLLDAPTGVGKSLLAIGAHRMLDERCIYITRTKQLQDQIMSDFGDIAVSLKGKPNYPCALKYDRFPDVTVEDCRYNTPKKCEKFSRCPYFVAKNAARNSPLVVLNDAYFLNEANGFNGAFSETDFLIVDEVDSIEAGLMNFIQFAITASQIDKLGLKMPADPSVRESWMEWIPEAARLLTGWAGQIDDRLSSSRQWGTEEILQGRIKRRYEKLAGKLEWLQMECDSNWLFYTRDNIDRRTGEQSREWVFKPVNIGRYAKYYLWGHGARSLGMSGTIFAPDIECRELGIGECDYMRMDCPFPLENRPVYYTPVVSLSRKTMPAELPVLCQEIDEILERYPSEKVLIHTVSYAVQSYLLKNLSCPGRLTYHTSGNREAALIEFKSSSQPLVMLSPSFDRGVDLPGEDNCGCIIVCKMPYLDLSDPQVKRKMESPGGGTWYALKTAQTLVQMCGRAVRSSTQRCDSYILDRQFSRLRSQLGTILPEWWLKAIKEKPAKRSAVKI